MAAARNHVYIKRFMRADEMAATRRLVRTFWAASSQRGRVAGNPGWRISSSSEFEID